MCYRAAWPGALTVQTVSKSRYDPTGAEYPVNLLRNMIIMSVRTSHTVYADVDFWPSTDLDSTLVEPSNRDWFAADSKLLTVVPVCHMYQRCREYKDCQGANVPHIPKRRDAMCGLIKKKQTSRFDPTNVGWHRSTKYIMSRD